MDPSKMNLNPISQLNPVVIVAMVFIIAVTYVLLRRLFVLPYLNVLEERERLFEAAEGRLNEADDSVSTAKQEAEELVADAATQAEKLRADAHTTADEYRKTCMTEATATANATLEHGRELIAADRAAELAKLHAQACECVGLACQRLLGKADDEAVVAAVDRALARHGG